MGAKLAFFVKNKRVKKWQLAGNWQFFPPNNGSMRSVPSTLPVHCPRRMPGHWAAKTCTSPWTSLAKHTKRLPTPGRNTMGTGISIILWGWSLAWRSSTKCPKKAWALPNANSSLAPLRPVISQMSDPRLQPVWAEEITSQGQILWKCDQRKVRRWSMIRERWWLAIPPAPHERALPRIVSPTTNKSVADMRTYYVIHTIYTNSVMMTHLATRLIHQGTYHFIHI